MLKKNNESSIDLKTALCAVASLPIAYLVTMYFSNGINPIYVIILACLLTFLYGRVSNLRNKLRITVGATIFSLGLSSALFLGNKLNLAAGILEPIHKRHILYVAAIFIAVFPIIFLLLDYCGDEKQFSIMASTDRKKRICFSLFGAALILAFYGIAYLCHFPSISTYDSWAVMMQASGEGPFSNWHPIIYTLIMRLFVGNSLWSLQTGVALFSLAQMLFMAVSAGYCIHWMLKRRLHPIFATVVTLYYALPPLFAAFSMTVWKDVPFGSVAVLYMLCLYDLLESKGTEMQSLKGAVRYVLLSYFMAMLRHNGFYIVVVITLILLILSVVKQKKQSLRVLPLLLLPVVLVVVSNEIAYALGVGKSFSSEAFSIPTQQMASTVVNRGVITEEQQEQLELYFDMEKLKEYDPFLADPAKNSIRQEYFNDNKSGFLKLWASLLPGNIRQYVEAYLLQTHGYWNPGDKAEVMLDPNANALAVFGVEKQHLIKIYGINSGLVRPFDFISIGLMVWIMLFCSVSLLVRKQYWRLISFLPILGVWGTIMLATPTDCSFRYIYALPLALPVLLFLTLSDKEKQSEI